MRFRVASMIAAAVICILCGPEATHGQGQRGGPRLESAWPDAGTAPPVAGRPAASEPVCMAAADEGDGQVVGPPGAARGPATVVNGESITEPTAGLNAGDDTDLAVADGTSGDPATWPCVADILARARSYTGANHFIAPARDNALEAYAEALRVSSRYQEEARAGIEAIKNQYARWATEAERREDWSGAAAFLRKALAATPGDGALLAALERVEDHGETRAAGGRPRPAVESRPEHVITQPHVPLEASRKETPRIASRRCAGAGDASPCADGESASDAARGGIFLATKIAVRKPEDDAGDAHPGGGPAGARGGIAARVPAPAATAAGKRWNVQVTAVREPAMAIAEAAHLRAAGYPAYVATFHNLATVWSRVRIGPFASRVEAGRAAARLRAQESLPEAFIISE